MRIDLKHADGWEFFGIRLQIPIGYGVFRAQGNHKLVEVEQFTGLVGNEFYCIGVYGSGKIDGLQCSDAKILVGFAVDFFIVKLYKMAGFYHGGWAFIGSHQVRARVFVGGLLHHYFGIFKGGQMGFWECQKTVFGRHQGLHVSAVSYFTRST